MNDAMAFLASSAWLSVGTVYSHTNLRRRLFSAERTRVYMELVRMLDERLTAEGELGMLFMDGDGSDEDAAKAFNAAADFIAEADEDELIADFSVREAMMLEAMQKVIRDGKVKMIRKPLRKKRLSAAQKAALRKARAKSHNAAARAARKKSMRVRKSRGM